MQVTEAAHGFDGVAHVEPRRVIKILPGVRRHAPNLLEHAHRIGGRLRQPFRTEDEQAEDGKDHDLADADVKHVDSVRRRARRRHLRGRSTLVREGSQSDLYGRALAIALKFDIDLFTGRVASHSHDELGGVLN